MGKGTAEAAEHRAAQRRRSGAGGAGPGGVRGRGGRRQQPGMGKMQVDGHLGHQDSDVAARNVSNTWVYLVVSGAKPLPDLTLAPCTLI